MVIQTLTFNHAKNFKKSLKKHSFLKFNRNTIFLKRSCLGTTFLLILQTHWRRFSFNALNKTCTADNTKDKED